MDERKIEVRKPLFDRLVDQYPDTPEVRPLRTLGRRELKESVRRELTRLLNTRVSLPAHRLPLRERSVVDYGIPDFSAYSARRHEDRVELGEIIRAAIAAFEPRLADVRVRLDDTPGDDGALQARIEATLLIGHVAEPVSFDTVLQVGDGGVEVAHAGE